MTSNATIPNTGLSNLSVEQLFGRFDHTIFFDQQDKLTILTAPNGFGKTMILRIIHNLMNGNFRFFASFYFHSIELKFADDKGVRIVRTVDEKDTQENSASPSPDIVFQYLGPPTEETDAFVYNTKQDEKLIRYIEKRFPVHRMAKDRWMDGRTDTILSTDELLGTYSRSFSQWNIGSFNIPKWLENLVGRTNSHLIETQRLLSLEADNESRHTRERRRTKTESVVENDATDLSERISQIVNQYATEAQKLDQTFPKRIIEQRANEVDSEDDVRSRLTSLTTTRSELVTAGLIGESEEEPISHADDLSDEDIRRILSIYISDTEDKLSVFLEIKEKVKLFKDILNEHFMFKKIHVNQHEGISAYDLDSEDPIRLSDLSSGEQHELVLIYELLFVVNDRAMILIDEPELSLHVGWQRQFIYDLRRIQNLRDLQFIVATHSPQIISDQWELVQELSYHE